MNLRKRSPLTAEVSTSSLNDIMFFLLLFFLIVSTLANPNVIKLLLPNSKSNSTEHKQPITVSVTKDRQYFVNNVPVEFDELETALSIKLKSISSPTVILRFDNSLSVQDLVDVYQIGDRLKVKMVLATKSPGR